VHTTPPSTSSTGSSPSEDFKNIRRLQKHWRTSKTSEDFKNIRGLQKHQRTSTSINRDVFKTQREDCKGLAFPLTHTEEEQSNTLLLSPFFQI
jgi:hypothetical protein